MGQEISRRFLLIWVYSVLLLSGVCILVYSLWPILSLEIKYLFFNQSPEKTFTHHQELAKEITPNENLYFLSIPKIDAFAPLVLNIDPSNRLAYEKALQDGVAHSLGSVFPGEPGNSFVFAHSSTSWQLAREVNTQFYLLNKLEVGDSIFVFHSKDVKEFKVTAKKIVNPDQVEYLQQFTPDKTLSLMTCYPIGTSLRRLIVETSLVTQVSLI